MKLTSLLLLAGCLQVSAHSTAQTVTYAAREAPLTQAFTVIEKQTGYVFFYDEDDLQGTVPVTVQFKATPLEEALRTLLANQPVRFHMNGTTIVITRKGAVTDIVIAAPPPADIHGRVTDSAGAPLAGANIIVKGTKKGASTDANGYFELKGVNGNVTLIISFTGYTQREYKVSGQSGFSISLGRSTSPLDEVQVIAYGTQSIRNSVGNVTTVQAEDIAKQPVSNPLLALEARVPGLFISQQSGAPGGAISVKIQGQNSYQAGNNPLYIIDGVPYDPSLLANMGGAILGVSNTNGVYGGTQTAGNPLSYLNPQDIESISVLKDADATSIYGSRAANGAILITTKKGKSGQTRIDINLQNGWGKMVRRLPLMNTQQYLQMRREAKRNDNAAIFNTDYDINGTWDTTRYTDWQKELLGGTAQYTDAQTGVSGGSANTQFLVSGNYHKETTVFPGDFSDQKAGVHFNFNTNTANRRFKLFLTGNYSFDNNNLPQTDFTGVAVRTAPDAPALYNPDGTLNWAPITVGTNTISTWNNPVATDLQTYQVKTTDLISNAVLSYQILPGLELKSNFGYLNLQSNELMKYPAISQKPETRPTAFRFAAFGYNSKLTWITEPQLSYSTMIKGGKLDALVGATIQQTDNKATSLFATGFTNDVLLDNIAFATSISVFRTPVISTYKYNALFGQLNYSLKEKYIIHLSARRDGSSRFGPASRFHNFGSAGMAWIFSKEQFMADKLPFLSFGKIKASYGTTGNDQIDDYRYISSYSSNSSAIPYQGILGFNPTALTNPLLQWEETKKAQAGVELGFFKDRLVVNATYSRNRSSNQLLGYQLPVITGFGFIIKNFPATIQNTNWEFSISSVNLKRKDFEWISNFNITLPGNKLVAFPNLATSTYATSLTIGQPIYISKVYRFLGVDPATGLYRVADSKGNPTTTPNYLTDLVSTIDLAPKFYGGLENRIRYKGFELDFMFQFVKQTGYTYFFGATGNAAFNTNEPTWLLQRWQKPGDNASFQRYNSNFSTLSSYFNGIGSDALFSDASYVRLKNVSFSYQLPAKWMNRAHIQGCRFYVQGQNLLTITQFKGLDPESQASASSVYSNLPPLRVITLGVQIGLQ